MMLNTSGSLAPITRLVPLTDQWQEGKTSASVAFVTLGEYAIEHGFLPDWEVPGIREKIIRVKDGDLVLTDFKDAERFRDIIGPY